MKKFRNPLGATALISLVLLAGLPVAGCSGTSIAQNIVNWTPVVESTASTVASVVSSLAPADAVIIGAALTGFNASAQLLSNQAKTYLANPNATALQQLQAQALAFQQNVNAALLTALKISNPGTQQVVITDLQALVTGLTAIVALIATIKGNTISPAAVAAPVKVAQILPLIDRDRAIAQIADHYQEPRILASMQFDQAIGQLQAAGL